MIVSTILGHTPIWVWFLLAFLISRGIMALRPREVSPGLMLILPVVFLIWGLTGMFGADGLVLKLAAFSVGALVGLALGRSLASLAPAPRFSRATGRLAMPGSPIALILICVAFATKYVGAVALAIEPDAAVRAEIALAMAAAGGLFAGLFWGRTLGQFARALRADGEPATFGRLVGLVLAKPSAPETAA